MVKVVNANNKGANKENLSPQAKRDADAKRKRDARQLIKLEGMSKPEKKKLLAERDFYIEKSRIAQRKVVKYKRLYLAQKDKYDNREDDFAASYKLLDDRLTAVKADNSCFSGACKDKFL